MKIECLRIAREMLGIAWGEPLPATLATRLLRVHEMCESRGGNLRSRQVIALIILCWQEEKES